MPKWMLILLVAAVATALIFSYTPGGSRRVSPTATPVPARQEDDREWTSADKSHLVETEDPANVLPTLTMPPYPYPVSLTPLPAYP